MKIGIQTWGSEGDIRPFLALAAGLVKAGHDVAVALTSISDKDYSDTAEKYGFHLKTVATPVFSDQVDMEAIGNQVVHEMNPVKQAALIMDVAFEPALDHMYQQALELCRDMDLVISHFIFYPMSVAAEETGAKYINVHLAHSYLIPHSQAPVGLPSLGRWLNPLWWKLVHKLLNRGMLTHPNRLRQKRDLPAVRDVIDDVWTSRFLNLVAISPSICRNSPSADQFPVCGFFNLPEENMDWEMDAGMQSFLDAGETPVYMTFGSLTPFTPTWGTPMLQVFLEAIQLANCRAIIQANNLSLEGLPHSDSVYYCQRLPHHKVFPHCAAVVHHGGAGTTQSATRAGVPSIVVAHIAEQEFWGNVLKQLSVAPAFIRRRSLNARQLAQRIRTVLDTPAMKQNAEKLAAQMRDEDGVLSAVEVINQRFSNPTN